MLYFVPLLLLIVVMSLMVSWPRITERRSRRKRSDDRYPDQYDRMTDEELAAYRRERWERSIPCAFLPPLDIDQLAYGQRVRVVGFDWISYGRVYRLNLPDEVIVEIEPETPTTSDPQRYSFNSEGKAWNGRVGIMELELVAEVKTA